MIGFFEDIFIIINIYLSFLVRFLVKDYYDLVGFLEVGFNYNLVGKRVVLIDFRLLVV